MNTLGAMLRIEIEQSDAELNTPARIDAKNTADALVAARAAIDADPWLNNYYPALMVSSMLKVCNRRCQ